MARQKNDGRGRMGGRTKGTPNKVTAHMHDVIASIIDGCLYNAGADLDALDPYHRMDILCKLIPYIMPKKQAISIDAQIKEEYANLEILLQTAPDDAVEAIAQRVMELNAKADEIPHGLAFYTQMDDEQN